VDCCTTLVPAQNVLDRSSSESENSEPDEPHEKPSLESIESWHHVLVPDPTLRMGTQRNGFDRSFNPLGLDIQISEISSSTGSHA
jgi:hypothetical protein